MISNEALTVRSAARDIFSSPSFPALSPARWFAVEVLTAKTVQSVPQLAKDEGGLDACYDYASALYGRGDECGAEEVWRALLPEALSVGRHDLAAYCSVRLSRCALDFLEFRPALDWCRRCRASSRHLPPKHPIHTALALASGLVHSGHGDWEGARRALAVAVSAPPIETALAERWEGMNPEDLKGHIYVALANLAMERALGAPPRMREGLLQEAWGWLHRSAALPLSERAKDLILVNQTEVNWLLGDLKGSRGRVNAWLDAALAGDEPLAPSRAPFLRLLSLMALSEEDLPESQRLMSEAYHESRRHRTPHMERRILRDLVRGYTKAHERRYGGRRENTVLKTLDSGGSWILDLVDFVETQDSYLVGRHSQLVRALCLALCPSPDILDRPGIPGDLDLPYLLGAASLHDIGKLDVSWALLNRVRPLGPLHEERLRAHVLAGGRILEDLGFPMTARLVEEHHERADGQGYPYGTRYQTLSGAFLALAETLVAMSQPSRACPNPPPVLDNARWCLREGARRFQPQAAAALHLAVESGTLLPFQAALAAS